MKRSARYLLVACLMFAVTPAVQTTLAASVQGTDKTVAVQIVDSPTKRSQTSPTPKNGQALNLNTASVDQLTQLPGIGNKTAAAIIDKRDELGGSFNSVDQLLGVKGIGKKKLEKIKPLLSL